MNSDALAGQLKKAGWNQFAPSEFLGVEFDAVGKATTARCNWFVLLKSIPLLDAAGLDAWSSHYAHFAKRAPATMFRSGKYFILLLLVDALSVEAAARLSKGPLPGFLEDPDKITGGGGYTIVILQDRKQVLMPRQVVLWDKVRAAEFVKRTHQAVMDFMTAMLPRDSTQPALLASGFGQVLSWDLERR